MRKTNLARLLARRVDGIFLSDFEQGEIGPDLFRHACLMGLEGLVSKHRESVYRGGRFDRWVKVKNRQHPAFRRFRMRSVCEERSRPPGVGLWAARSPTPPPGPSPTLTLWRKRLQNGND